MKQTLGHTHISCGWIDIVCFMQSNNHVIRYNRFTYRVHETINSYVHSFVTLITYQRFLFSRSHNNHVYVQRLCYMAHVIELHEQLLFLNMLLVVKLI